MTRLNLTLDESQPDPLYKQIFDQLVTQIRTGLLPPGYKLPATRELAGQIGTHRNTVVHAYEELVQAGFATSGVGKGTFVAGSARDKTPVAAPEVSTSLASLPWEGLISHSLFEGLLSRSERLPQHLNTFGSHINLARMQPSPDLLPVDLIFRCAQHVQRTQGARALGYGPAEGLFKLRRLIAEDLQKLSIPCTPDEVVITSGSQQGLELAVRLLVSPGECVLVEEQTYAGMLNILAAAGARVLPIPSDDEGPVPSALEKALQARPKFIYLMPNVRNPTSSVISLRRRQWIQNWAHKNSIVILEDDYGADLGLTEMDPPLALRAMDNQVIYVGSFSKKLIPALRIGFLVLPRALMPYVAKLKAATDLGSSLLMQHTLAEFMERGYLKAHLARVLPEYRTRRDAMEKALRELIPLGVSWRTPERGLSLWLRLPRHVSSLKVFEEAQREGVLVNAGSWHSAAPNHLDQGVRLAFCGESPERITQGVERLGKALKRILNTDGNVREGSFVELGYA